MLTVAQWRQRLVADTEDEDEAPASARRQPSAPGMRTIARGRRPTPPRPRDADGRGPARPGAPPSTGSGSAFDPALRGPGRRPIDDLLAPEPYRPPPFPVPPWLPQGFMADCHIEAPPPPSGELNPKLQPPVVGDFATRREIVDPPDDDRSGYAARSDTESDSRESSLRALVPGRAEHGPRIGRARGAATRVPGLLGAPTGLDAFVGGWSPSTTPPRTEADRGEVYTVALPAILAGHRPPIEGRPADRYAKAALLRKAQTAQPEASAGPHRRPSAIHDTFAAPERPLCPPGYSFDYDFQSCWNRPHRPPRAGRLWAHACKCGRQESYLALERRCWRRGTVPVSATPHPTSFRAAAGPGPFCQEYEPACLETFERDEVWIRYDFCSHSEKNALQAAAIRARRVASSAARFLQHVATLPQGELKSYWTFGDTDANPLTPGLAWQASPAPSYWFGEYSAERLARAEFVAQMVSDRLFHGFSYLNILSWPLHLRCANLCTPGTVALHWAEGFVKICPSAFTLFDHDDSFLDRPAGPEGLAMLLFHELCHRSGLWPLLHDAGAYGPVAARQLIVDGRAADAYRNIENFVYWSFARYRFFGPCTWWATEDHAQSCYGGGDESGNDATVCCHRCLGGYWGDCHEA